MSGENRAVVPIESNPEVFTNFAHKLGLKMNGRISISIA